MLNDKDQIKIYYFRISDIWNRLCEEHSRLYDLSVQEYQVLLENDIDKLDDIVKEKDIHIQNISQLDSLRKEVLSEMNQKIPSDHKIENILGLIDFFSTYEKSLGNNYFSKFNQLLIQIIEKVKFQNKANQKFVNKAIISLENIKNETLGVKSYQTYTNRGQVGSTNSQK